MKKIVHILEYNHDFEHKSSLEQAYSMLLKKFTNNTYTVHMLVKQSFTEIKHKLFLDSLGENITKRMSSDQNIVFSFNTSVWDDNSYYGLHVQNITFHNVSFVDLIKKVNQMRTLNPVPSRGMLTDLADMLNLEQQTIVNAEQ